MLREDLTLISKDNYEAFKYAVRTGNEDIVKHLFSSSQIRDDVKVHCFELALERGLTRTAKLVHKDSKVVQEFAENMNVKKPLLFAQISDNADMVYFLSKFLSKHAASKYWTWLGSEVCSEGLVNIALMLQVKKQMQVDAKCIQNAVRRDRCPFVRAFLPHHQIELGAVDSLTMLFKESFSSPELSMLKELTRVYHDDVSVILVVNLAVDQREKKAVRFLITKYKKAAKQMHLKIETACKVDDHELVMFLLKSASKQKDENKFIWSALASAVKNGAIQTLKVLHQLGHVKAQLNTLLYLACKRGNTQSVKFLLDRKAIATTDHMMIALRKNHDEAALMVFHDPSMKDLKATSQVIKYGIGKNSSIRAPELTLQHCTKALESFKEKWWIKYDYSPVAPYFQAPTPKTIHPLEKFIANAFFDRHFLLLPFSADKIHGYYTREYKHVTNYFDKYLRLFNDAYKNKLSAENLSRIAQTHAFIEDIRITSGFHDVPFDPKRYQETVNRILKKTNKDFARYMVQNERLKYDLYPKEKYGDSVFGICIDGMSLVVRYAKPYWDLFYFHSKSNQLGFDKKDLSQIRRSRVSIEEAARLVSELAILVLNNSRREIKYSKRDILKVVFPWEDLEIQEDTLSGTVEDILKVAGLKNNITDLLVKEVEADIKEKHIYGILKRFIENSRFMKGGEIAIKLTTHNHDAVATFSPLDKEGKTGIWRVFNTGLGAESNASDRIPLYEEFKVTTKWVLEHCSDAISDPRSKTFREHYYPSAEIGKYDQAYDWIMEKTREVKNAEKDIAGQESGTCSASSVWALQKYSLGSALYHLNKTFGILYTLDCVFRIPDRGGEIHVRMFDEQFQSFLVPAWGFVSHTNMFEKLIKKRLSRLEVKNDDDAKLKDMALELLKAHCGKFHIDLNAVEEDLVVVPK